MKLIEVLIRVRDAHLDDLGIEQDGELRKCFIDIDKIALFYDATDNETGDDVVSVWLIGGDSVLVYNPSNLMEFKKLLT